MSHYEERLERDLELIRKDVSSLADSVVNATESAIHALLTGNEKLASTIVLEDGPINRKMRDIDAKCHSFMAVHLPSGVHLRLISSVIRINITLERIGDYAVTIARELMQLDHKPEGDIAKGVERMSNEAITMLKQAIDAFNSDDADLSKETMKLAQKTVSVFDDVLASLVAEQKKRDVTDLFALFVVFHHLVRIADQAKNICEDTVFAITGETKAKKVYRILFVDEDNSCLGIMAQLIARKSFSHAGVFNSAGRMSCLALNPGLKVFLGNRGIDLEDAQPQSISDIKHEIDTFHVIVSLQGSARTYIPNIPFHTTLLDWDIGDLPSGEGEASDQRYDEIYRDLAVQIQDLMLLLRGEEST